MSRFKRNWNNRPFPVLLNAQKARDRNKSLVTQVPDLALPFFRLTAIPESSDQPGLLARPGLYNLANGIQSGSLLF